MRLSQLTLPAFTAAAALVLAPLTSQAGTDTGNLSVSARVDAACTIGDATLPFGIYDPASTTAATNSATFSVQCTNLTTYDITLGGGSGGLTSGNVRTMKINAADTTGLNYELFSDVGLTTALGIGTKLAGTGDGNANDVTIYGRIPVGQFVTVGTYNDTVLATINF
jgi:spore coat protein U-like protein